MLRKLTIGTIKLPRIYVASTRSDAMKAREGHLPYIYWSGSDETLAKLVLLPALRKMFPHIDWVMALDLQTFRNRRIKVKCDHDITGRACSALGDVAVSDYTEDYRVFDNEGTEGVYEVPINRFAGDIASHVNIDQLMALGYMPTFMADIRTAISKNIELVRWEPGWNKKRGMMLGNMVSAPTADNLLIVDISASIPTGISSTMIGLLKTLVATTRADLIVTGATTMYWAYGEEIPDPQWIRGHIGRCNESRVFKKLFNKYIAGREFSNVISFGDNDTPMNAWMDNGTEYEDEFMDKIRTVRVHEVWHYHTWLRNRETGYARWCDASAIKPVKHYDTTWCEVMD